MGDSQRTRHMNLPQNYQRHASTGTSSVPYRYYPSDNNPIHRNTNISESWGPVFPAGLRPYPPNEPPHLTGPQSSYPYPHPSFQQPEFPAYHHHNSLPPRYHHHHHHPQQQQQQYPNYSETQQFLPPAHFHRPGYSNCPSKLNSFDGHYPPGYLMHPDQGHDSELVAPPGYPKPSSEQPNFQDSSHHPGHSEPFQDQSPPSVPPPGYPVPKPQDSIHLAGQPDLPDVSSFSGNPYSNPTFAPDHPNGPTAPSLEIHLGSSPSQFSPNPSLFQPTTDLALDASYVELEISAENLKKRDIIGTSDPICCLQVPARNTPSSQKVTEWKTVCKTEVLQNTTSPHWTNRIPVPYLFEKHQPLRFLLVDVDNFRSLKGNFLGMCDVLLASIVREGTLSAPLSDPRGKPARLGTVTIRAHDKNASGQVRVKLSMAAKGLCNVDLFGRSDPYFRVECLIPGSSNPINLVTSETIMNDLNPSWKQQQMIVPTSNKSWDDIKLKFSVFDWNQTAAHRLIGDAILPLSKLTGPMTIELENPPKRIWGRNRKAGQLSIREVKSQEMPTFTSYLRGGLRLEFVVAVDFTASNKAVSNTDSLHYMGKDGSVYFQALRSVGTVISSYIKDELITALGFGGKLSGATEASFDFSLSGLNDPHVKGVKGLLEAYVRATRSVRLSGPTKFTPLIRNTMESCEREPVSQGSQKFTVLLIITDGIISDMKDTVDAVIDASHNSPLSIVIVGVGDEDFSAMKELDGDAQLLRSKEGQREAKRDIVHFVHFDSSGSMEELAAEVLYELPQHIVEYMMDCGISPNVNDI